MRRLMWFTVGFGAACLLCVCVLWDRSLLPILASAGVLLGLALALHGRIPAAILLGILAGTGWIGLLQACFYDPLLPYDGETVPLVITADTFSEQGLYSMTFDGKAELHGKHYPVRVYLKEDREVSPGDRLESEYRIRLTVPNGLKESSYYQSQGILMVATQKGEMLHTPAGKITWKTWPAYTANRIKMLLHASFSPEDAAFAQALLLGDSTELPYEMDTALKVSGIRHIVAVSGLHVSLLLGLVLLALRSTRVLMPVLAVTVLSGFAAITGFTPSVARACIMGGLYVLSLSFRREYDSPTALAAACLAMLLRNPFLVLSVSFQLSVSSVAGILAFSAPLNQKLLACVQKYQKNRIVRWCAGTAAVSLSALSLSLPLSAYYFETVSLIGPITNMLCLWLVSVIFCGLGLMSGIPALAAVLAKPLSMMIHTVLWAASTLSKFPLAAVYTCSPWIAGWLVLCGVLFGVFLLRQRQHWKRYAAAAGISLVLAVAISWMQPRLDDTRLTVLSVGEGQSLLLQSKGKTFLVDCGGSSDAKAANAAAQMLISQGIFRIEGLLLTHYDRDHSGGVLPFLSRIRVDKLYLPDMEDKGFLSGLDQKWSVQMIREDTQLSLGTGMITLYQPGQLKTDNENSMCILFDTENCDILITGDRGVSGEKRWIKEHPDIEADVLIAGHHGSKNSTSVELLEGVKPEVVVVSAGRNNSYGHPAEELLDRLKKYNCRVYRTDLDGTIVIRR